MFVKSDFETISRLAIAIFCSLIMRDVKFWIAKRFVTRHKYAANLITLSRLEGPLSSSENTLLHCRQFINGHAQPILCTSNTLLKIINKQQAHKAPIKCRMRIFDLLNAISAPHNTLIQLPTARHNNAAHLIAPRSHTNFPFVSRARRFRCRSRAAFLRVHLIEMYQKQINAISRLPNGIITTPQNGTEINLTIEINIFYFGPLGPIYDLIGRVYETFPLLV